MSLFTSHYEKRDREMKNYTETLTINQAVKIKKGISVKGGSDLPFRN
jgi:hypothetical protein